MNQVFMTIAITGFFLSCTVPVILGIIHYVRENRRLDREAREKDAKSTSNQGA